MLSISDFSQMCHLSPQTLRFYHAEDLLVPADVNEQNGYRWYAFDQVEQAMLITVLRNSGMSVELVRQAMRDPDAAAELLREHREHVCRQRQAQDDALEDAREFLQTWPGVHRRHAPQMTAVSQPVPGSSDETGMHDWAPIDAAVLDTVRYVTSIVESCGAAVTGAPFSVLSKGARDQMEHSTTMAKPRWLVNVPFVADEQVLEGLPDDVEVLTFEAREELSIFVPGKSSMAKYATAISRLCTHSLQDVYIDVSRMRHILHDSGVETAAPLCQLDEVACPPGRPR